MRRFHPTKPGTRVSGSFVEPVIAVEGVAEVPATRIDVVSAACR